MDVSKISKYLGYPTTVTNTYAKWVKSRNLGNATIYNFPIAETGTAIAEITFIPGEIADLVLLEIACIGSELSGFEMELLKLGYTISAVHNHWVSKPQVFYIHCENLGEADKLAKKISDLWDQL